MAGRYPMGAGWQAGVQTRTQFGVTYKYSAYLPSGAGRRGYGGRGSAPATARITSGTRPLRVRIPGGRSR